MHVVEAEQEQLKPQLAIAGNRAFQAVCAYRGQSQGNPKYTHAQEHTTGMHAHTSACTNTRRDPQAKSVILCQVTKTQFHRAFLHAWMAFPRARTGLPSGPPSLAVCTVTPSLRASWALSLAAHCKDTAAWPRSRNVASL